MRRPNPPCKTCKDRTESCHAKCLQFKAYSMLKRKYDRIVFNNRLNEFRAEGAQWLPHHKATKGKQF